MNSVEPPPTSNTRYGAGSVEPGRRAGERRARLLLAGDQLRAGRRSRPRPRRRTRRGSSASRDALVAVMRTRSTPSSSMRGAVLAQHRDRALDRVGMQRAGRVDALAEAGDARVPLDRVASGASRPSVDVGDEQARRVGADVDRGDVRHAPPLRSSSWAADPAADRIVTAGEVEGVVRVQALHAGAGAADAARRPRAGVVGRRGRRRARARTRSCAASELVAVDVALRPRARRPVDFEPRDADAEVGIDEPVPRRHRRAVVEQRRVADHDRRARRHRAPTTSNAARGARPSSSVSTATSACGDAPRLRRADTREPSSSWSSGAGDHGERPLTRVHVVVLLAREPLDLSLGVCSRVRFVLELGVLLLHHVDVVCARR